MTPKRARDLYLSDLPSNIGLDLVARADRVALDNQRRVRSVALTQVLRVVELRGCGDVGAPYREVVTYWSLDGHCLADVDPATPEAVRPAGSAPEDTPSSPRRSKTQGGSK